MFSPFRTTLSVDILPPHEVKGGRQLYALKSPLEYASPAFGEIVVPEGFMTDFASIPRLLWRYLDPEDPCVLYPSVIHDFVYSRQGVLPDRARALTREDADELFREAMRHAFARWDQCAAAYRAVRWFGSSHWQPA